MADQSQTATNKQSEPARCKQGCGFFGNAATSGFCSKCWSDVQKTKSAVASAVVPPPTPEICRTIEAVESVVAKPAPSLVVQAKVPTVPVESSSATTAAMITPRSTATATPKSTAATPKVKTITSMSSSSSTKTPANSESAPAPVANAPAKKKKKKKTSYKNMMASMMKETTKRDDDDDDDKAKKAIRKVTGGGAFSKIDKI